MKILNLDEINKLAVDENIGIYKASETIYDLTHQIYCGKGLEEDALSVYPELLPIDPDSDMILVLGDDIVSVQLLRSEDKIFSGYDVFCKVRGNYVTAKVYNDPYMSFLAVDDNSINMLKNLDTHVILSISLGQLIDLTGKGNHAKMITIRIYESEYYGCDKLTEHDTNYIYS